MSATLGWGIIGCGDVVLKKSGPSIRAAPRSRIVTMMRRDPGRLAEAAAALGALRSTTDPAAVLADPAVDIVYVATPPSSHLDLVLQAAAAGKHVLVEKPMALNAADSRRMVEACATAGVRLFVAYYRRFWPHVLAMKRLLEEGGIGTPLHTVIDFALPWANGPGGWRLDPAVNGGGYFVDMGSHRLDLWTYLLGPIAEAGGTFTPHASNPRLEAGLVLHTRFANGALGLACGDFASGRSADRFEIIGSAGRIVSERLDGHAFSIEAGGTSREVRCERLAAPHLGLIRHIEAVLLDGAASQADGRDGVATDRLLDLALRRGRLPDHPF